MILLAQTVMTNGRRIQLHRTTFKKEPGYIVQDGAGRVRTFTDRLEAWSLYKVWATP